jgi:hypothetical protein
MEDKIPHLDAYPHDCPGCIYDPRSGATLLNEHTAAVVKLRRAATSTPLKLRHAPL